MLSNILDFSIKNKILVALGVVALVLAGLYTASKIPLDAVPDITNNQVQVVTVSPSLAPQEVEELVTYPVEAVMTNIPDVEEVRSISRYGLSVVTIVFKENISTLNARQLVSEQLNIAQNNIAPELGIPEMMPTTTGLGEIYQYVLTLKKGYENSYNTTELRSIQDWIVKRQLNGTKGIIEISSFGGFLKEYEVAVNPQLLQSYHVTMQELLEALENNNENSGGSYIEQGPNAFYIRTEGRAKTQEDLENIVVSNEDGVAILVKNVAQVKIGSAKRYGAMTMDGKGEVVGGITLMLKGANSSEAIGNVKNRIAEIRKSLPEGVDIYPFLDRKALIMKTISTAQTNLIEGGLIVIFILLLLLGNLRAGLIVASVIPLSMLFALIMMYLFGVSANLMSLGAIDFGIVVDGAVVIVEAILLQSVAHHSSLLTAKKDDNNVALYRSTLFGVLIILVVFIPIFTLEGIEGKTFRPMAQTVGFAILGSLILSLTYVPMMCSIFLKNVAHDENSFSEKGLFYIKNSYKKLLDSCLNNSKMVIGVALLIFIIGIFSFQNMGAEFVPTLSEGDFAVEQNVKPGSSLQESVATSLKAQALLLKTFPNEIKHVVGKTGTAEVPTDPMGIEETDLIVVTKDEIEWTTTKDRDELVRLMEEKLKEIPWATYEITQPIQMRFNELMSGSKSDIAIKIFGEDLAKLADLGEKTGEIVAKINGAADIKVDRTEGLQQLKIDFNREKIAQHGLNIKQLNQIIRAAFAGEIVGNIYEQERKYSLVVRLQEDFRQKLNLSQLSINGNNGQLIPLSEVATVSQVDGPMEIAREQARRNIGIGVNVRNRDIASVVKDIQSELSQKLPLPVGYSIQYGGQYENLQNAQKRLLIALPIALTLIIILLYIAFNSMKDTFLIFIAVPFSAVGGVFALILRGMPFSISAGVGFIALFGVAVLNGIVLISKLKEHENDDFSLLDVCAERLRPVLMTALVAALGFVPMAVSTGNGAEVQKPLATVVIGGLLTSTLLTLFVLPILYTLFTRFNFKNIFTKSSLPVFCILFLSFFSEKNYAKNAIDSLPPQWFSVYQNATNNNASLKNLRLQRNAEALNYKTVNVLPSLEVAYSGGQINESIFDHNLQVNQSIGTLFFQKDKKNTIDSKLQFIDNQVNVLERKHYFDLWNIYNSWQLAQQNIAQYDAQDAFLSKLKTQFETRLKNGDVNRLDYHFFNNYFLQWKKEKTQASQALLDLREESFKQVGVELSPDVLSTKEKPKAIPYDFSTLKKINPLFFDAYSIDNQILAKEKILNYKTSKTPDLKVGYFAQSLNRTFLYQGVNLGVSVPLDKRMYKVKSEQLELKRQENDNQRNALERQLQNELDLANLKLLALKANLDAFENSFTKGITEQKALINKQLEAGEIDYLRFTQLFQNIHDTEKSYYELLYEWNKTVIFINFLTGK